MPHLGVKYYQQSPVVLIDVGARGGIPARWKPIAHHTKVIGFEPEHKEFRKLVQGARDQQQYLNTMLDSKRGSRKLYITRQPGGSSFFRPNNEFLKRFPNSERFTITRTAVLRTDTLDHQLRTIGVRDADFIKLDTQGSELAILRGASQVLRKSIFGIELEVEFAPLYHKQPLFGAVDSFIRKLGFELFDINQSYWKRSCGVRYGGPKGQIVAADALYFKNTTHFQHMLARLPNVEEQKMKMARALVICALYGYLDYAVELIVASEFFDSGEQDELLAIIKREISLAERVPNFRGRRRLATLVGKIGAILTPRYGNGYYQNGTLGNREQ